MTAIFIDCPEFLAGLYTPELKAIVPDLVLEIGDPSPGQTKAMVAGAKYVINDHTYLPDEILSAAPGLKAIVFMGTGASSYIDLAAAERRGVRVRTISGYGDRSIAEHAVALMFAAGRRVAEMDRAIRAGGWQTVDGIEFLSKTLGVVGTGGIGTEMVRLGAGLGMNVIAWNRSGVAGGLPCEAVELDGLMARADVVSLHLGLNEETTGIIDRRRLALMKPAAILVNTARGALVDEPAMIEALKGGRLRHAGLDVFADEPLAAGHPLTTLANVTLTGHAAFMTREASIRLLRTALEYLREERGKDR
jgi:D-3-phosphoglycerate dehydrogenase